MQSINLHMYNIHAKILDMISKHVLVFLTLRKERYFCIELL